MSRGLTEPISSSDGQCAQKAGGRGGQSRRVDDLPLRVEGTPVLPARSLYFQVLQSWAYQHYDSFSTALRTPNSTISSEYSPEMYPALPFPSPVRDQSLGLLHFKIRMADIDPKVTL